MKAMRRAATSIILLVLMLQPATVQAQQDPTSSAASKPETVHSEGLRRQPPESAPDTGTKQAQPNQQNGNATSGPTIQHGASEAPENKGSGRNDGGTNDGKGLKQDEHLSPEALTARYTYWLFGATLALAAGTFVLAVGTTVLAAATIGLHRETKKLANEAAEQRKDNQRLIVATEKAADAAVENAQIADGTLKRDRAWLTFLSINVDEVPNPKVDNDQFPIGIRISIAWTNSGKSVAFCAAFFNRYQIIDPEHHIVPFDLPPLSEKDGKGFIAPGQPGGAMSMIIVGDDYERFVNSKSDIAIYTAATYRLGSNSGEKKFTQMCGVMKFRGREILQNGRIKLNVPFSMRGDQNSID